MTIEDLKYHLNKTGYRHITFEGKTYAYRFKNDGVRYRKSGYATPELAAQGLCDFWNENNLKLITNRQKYSHCDLDPNWCAWFSGFFDGEGHLRIDKSGCPRAEILLREDDAKCLEDISEKLGGYIRKVDRTSARKTKGSNERNQVSWSITGLEECKRFVNAINMSSEGDWNNWLAGFCDAEASFLIRNDGFPKIQLNLRIDDLPVLLEISRIAGGEVYLGDKTRERNLGKMAQDQALWNITRTDRLLSVADRLKGRMRTKKAKEFKIWYEALKKSQELNHGFKSSQRKPLMLEYKAKLEAIRAEGRYKPELNAGD